MMPSSYRGVYGNVAESHELLYPHRLIPRWAQEIVQAFDRAGYKKLGIATNGLLKRYVKNTAERCILAQAMCTIAELAVSGPSSLRRVGPDPRMPDRIMLMLEEAVRPKRIKEEDRVSFDVAHAL